MISRGRRSSLYESWSHLRAYDTPNVKEIVASGLEATMTTQYGGGVQGKRYPLLRGVYHFVIDGPSVGIAVVVVSKTSPWRGCRNSRSRHIEILGGDIAFLDVDIAILDVDIVS